jgi:hypothetical protein
VEIHEGADVGAFLMREPWLLPGGGYGSVAAEAYGVTGSIFVVPVLEVEAVGGWVEPRVGHKVACFRATDFDAINKSNALTHHPIINSTRSQNRGICPGWERCARLFVYRRAARRGASVPK